MLTEKKESRAIPKVRILVESHTAKHLKTFRIISGEMPVSLLSYVDDILVACRCIKKFLVFTFMSFNCFFFSNLCDQGIQLS